MNGGKVKYRGIKDEQVRDRGMKGEKVRDRGMKGGVGKGGPR